MTTSKKLQSIAATIASDCLAVRIRTMSRVITAIYDHALSPIGLTVNQLNMLVAIARIQKPTAKSLAGALQMEASTVSRNLDRMRKEGWLRIVSGQGGRKQELGITQKGADLVEKAFPAWREAQKHAQATLGEKKFAAMARIAESIWAPNRNSS
ncbi:MarR family winged helix-turn-helix transcriptional regulator [bacterium]|nr:MarR family winged helix-turn-helix transcriptional regulator [bacterium]